MSSVVTRLWVEVSPNIHLDNSLWDELRKAVLKEIEKIAELHEAPLLKVEVIPWDPTWDGNFNSVIIRWVSEKGIFGRLYSSCVGWKISQAISPLSDVEEATTIIFDFMEIGKVKQV